MSEVTWNARKNPNQALKWLIHNKASERKLRLAAVAFCRRLTPASPDPNWMHAIETAEQRAEFGSDQEARMRADTLHFDMVERERKLKLADPSFDYQRSYAIRLAMSWYVEDVARSAYHAVTSRPADSRQDEKNAQCAIIRDIFGNPFRPVTLDPCWLTSTVIDLARTIYEERVWERMPILADALMDADCDSDEIINHCRGPGPHVRGCWVVDLLLRKE